MRKVLSLVLLLIFTISFAHAQKTEVTISLNEQFFDALLDAVFQHASPEFPLAQKDFHHRDTETRRNTFDLKHRPTEQFDFNRSNFIGSALSSSVSPRLSGSNPPCNDSIRLLRENNGARTAVRFRDGKILAPLAFSGSYNPPFIGCLEFSGYAETNIDLQFDQNSQRLIARARVLNVSLNGTNGVGGAVIARMIQSSIDKKINPIEIIRMDKVSFVVPIQNSRSLKMKAVGIRHEISNGVLNVYIAYEFLKA